MGLKNVWIFLVVIALTISMGGGSRELIDTTRKKDQKPTRELSETLYQTGQP